MAPEEPRDVIWMRPEHAATGRPAQRSRTEITAAAVTIADQEGLTRQAAHQPCRRRLRMTPESASQMSGVDDQAQAVKMCCPRGSPLRRLLVTA